MHCTRKMETFVTIIGNNLKTSMDNNTLEMKREIDRIDKRLDEQETKTTNLIDKAIEEALKRNNRIRDEELSRKLEEVAQTTSKYS